MRSSWLACLVFLSGCGEVEVLKSASVFDTAPSEAAAVEEVSPTPDAEAPEVLSVDRALEVLTEIGPVPEDMLILDAWPDAATEVQSGPDIPALDLQEPEAPPPADHVVPEEPRAPDDTPADRVEVDRADAQPARDASSDVSSSQADSPDAALDAALDAPLLPLDIPMELQPDVFPDMPVPPDEPGPSDALAPRDVLADRSDAVSCGSLNASCCPGRVCGAALGCSASSRCVPCGGRGQPCCLSGGALCAADWTCRGSTLTCECGNAGELCCPGYTCSGASTGITCRVVGSRRLCG